MGFDVTAAEDFESAIKIIEGPAPIDLLIADIGLRPGTPHGIAIGNMAQSKRIGLKVIYMSGAYDLTLTASYGDASAVLQKPFTAEELADVVTAIGLI